MLELLSTAVKEHCYGCEVNHPPQTQHSCLMYEEDEQMEMYVSHLLEKIYEQLILSVLCDFVDPLPDDKILDWSKLKQNADDTLKCI